MSFIRFFYILLTAAAFPLAFLHFRSFRYETLQQMGETSKSALIFFSFFLMLFHLLYKARYFPFDKKTGIQLLIGIIITVGSSSALNNASPFLGAFALVFSISLSYLIYFITMCIVFANKRKRELYFYYDEKPYIWMLLFFLTGSLITTLVLAKEYINAILNEEILVLVVFALVLLGYDVYMNVVRLMQQNMFQFDKGPEKEARDKQLKGMAWYVILFLFLSIAGSAVVVFLP